MGCCMRKGEETPLKDKNTVLVDFNKSRGTL
jgi:hypothetical protein